MNFIPLGLEESHFLSLMGAEVSLCRGEGKYSRQFVEVSNVLVRLFCSSDPCPAGHLVTKGAWRDANKYQEQNIQL